ncbi:hypothetical protein ACFFLS_08905 [Flavobacterium procerum]|uniref:Lipoprotein n=1 Tax=Flavobacterium procerum TaxID=1455569 RepID=A0ABV6BSX8_9FLAO
MKKHFILIVSILLVILIQSCNKKEVKSESKNAAIIDSLPNNEEFEENGEEYDEDLSEDVEVIYPETGNKTADFLPKPAIYEIQYEAKGDLNKDGLDDVIVVLKHKQVNTAKRPMLILLQNANKTYRLDKVSDVVMPAEYNENDFKFYDPENISVEEGALRIYLWGGPHNMILCKFKYSGKDLVLTYMTSYSGGAGQCIETTADYEKGEGTIAEIYTMDENSSPISTFKTKSEKHLFENTSILDLYNGEENAP